MNAARKPSQAEIVASFQELGLTAEGGDLKPRVPANASAPTQRDIVASLRDLGIIGEEEHDEHGAAGG